MNIGINARHLIKGKLEGIGWYSFEILNRLILLMPNHKFFFFYDRKTDFLISGDNVFNLILNPPARHPILFRIWFNYVLPRNFKKFKIDLFFSPDGFISLNTLIPQIGVMHDLNFEHYPEDLPKNVLKYYQKYMPLFAQTAEKIINVYNIHNLLINYLITAPFPFFNAPYFSDGELTNSPSPSLFHFSSTSLIVFSSIVTTFGQSRLKLSFARIFYRNAVDGAFLLPIEIEQDAYDGISESDEIEIDVSKIKGTFDPVGVPKQIGFVPNKLFNAP